VSDQPPKSDHPGIVADWIRRFMMDNPHWHGKIELTIRDGCIQHVRKDESLVLGHLVSMD
jgi:hypothetical protein